MKRVLLAVALCIGLATPVHADTPPTLVLIDSGVNDAQFTNNIVYEVCTIEYTFCANGTNYMEGKGSANTTGSSNATMNHGNEMLSIMVKVNPAIKVIPIKIVGMTDKGNPYLYTLASVKSALDWVVANRVKFNISVVSLSEGKIFDGCSVPAGLASDVATLKANNVQLVAASGNAGSRVAMDSPSCLPDAISVGATDNPWGGVQPYAWDSKALPTIAKYSNSTPQTTVFANGRWFATALDGNTKFIVGTSIACASVASWVMLHKGVDWNSTYQNLISNATGTATTQGLTGRYLFINS